MQDKIAISGRGENIYLEVSADALTLTATSYASFSRLGLCETLQKHFNADALDAFAQEPEPMVCFYTDLGDVVKAVAKHRRVTAQLLNELRELFPNREIQPYS